jgi:hypothetical protein
MLDSTTPDQFANLGRFTFDEFVSPIEETVTLMKQRLKEAQEKIACADLNLAIETLVMINCAADEYLAEYPNARSYQELLKICSREQRDRLESTIKEVVTQRDAAQELLHELGCDLCSSPKIAGRFNRLYNGLANPSSDAVKSSH